MIKIICLFLLTLTFNCYGDSLYQITLLRAAPGALGDLMTEAQQIKKSEKGNLIIMRHSQGDHWDLMLLRPSPKLASEELKFTSLVAFQHSFLSESRMSWEKLKQNAENNGLYHIEMFHAAAGQYDALLKQRQMENAYYQGTGRPGNVIFTTVFGSDMDIFTLGFYKDMLQFATDPDLSDEVYAKAATDAGFESRATIGLYLRQFLSSHFDTLATKVD